MTSFLFKVVENLIGYGIGEVAKSLTCHLLTLGSYSPAYLIHHTSKKKKRKGSLIDTSFDCLKKIN